MTTAESFTHFTDIEHIKSRPDMYIGSIKCTKEERWILKDGQMSFEEIESNPGLEQCILELIVNSADHAERCKNGNKVSKIFVEHTDDYFSIQNNGEGIPIEINKKMNLYVPEMIFGNLRTSSNYDDTQKRTVGGRNGIGSKAANIFSSKFYVEVKTGNKKYYQEFLNGMTEKTEPVIEKVAGKDNYTKITFYPDFKAFGMKSFSSNQINKVILKRVYDLSAATSKDTSVFYNDEKLKVKNFSDYIDLYTNGSQKVVYSSDRWEIGFTKCPYVNSVQISFVNGICTEDGGTHVNYILTPVIKKITEELQNKNKKITINSSFVKDNIMIFIKSLIENPTFNSQLKRKLETKVSEFGSKCEIPKEIIEKVVKLGICDGVIELSKAKEMKSVLKSIEGTKQVRLTDILKLEDANWAGTSKSSYCTLILTEGDSAKKLALDGIPSAGGRDRWGVFPLKGKFINIRTATAKQLSTNEEIRSVNRIIGLKIGSSDISKLRYGKIMIMTDSDVDGYHIKGLLINYFTYYWPELIEKGILHCMITPLVKVFDGRNKVVNKFYNLDDYKTWLSNTENSHKFRAKYYKGLGTSTASESKEYFMDMESNRITYLFKKGTDLPLIKNIFDKDYAEYRKNWITEALSNKLNMDYNIKKISIDYFINRELVQFSIYDNIRSIPSVIDGLKPSQRKILFGCLKKNLFIKQDGTGEIKVSQLSGYISEHTAYHHGEESLQKTIVSMAQEFVGSGNFNLLIPKGNFGSRNQGGEDSASARYIFTALRPEVKILFNENDNEILNYLEEEGERIEPNFYVPIVPLLLLNGSSGIGTGWSTDIPCYNLSDIINNIKLLIADEKCILNEIPPFYKGFKGTIKKFGNVWKSIGSIKQINGNTIEINELPIGVWKQKYKEYLEEMIEEGLIRNVEVNDNDKNKTSDDVCFKITLNEKEDNIETLIKKFKLEKTIQDTNMMAFNEHGIITKYNSVNEILWEFYEYRLSFYSSRKKHLIDVLEKKIKEISERLRFITMVVDDKIIIFKQTKDFIKEQLTSNKFENQEILLSIKINKFTKEEIKKLEEELEELIKELDIIVGTTTKQMWLNDLQKIDIEKLNKLLKV